MMISRNQRTSADVSALATRRTVVAGALASGVASLITSRPARAADWPNRPVTIIVPFPPGGNTDTMARLLAQKLSEKFGRAFLVDNRIGASGAIGASAVARAAPDGYTLMFAAVQQFSVIPFTEHVNYNPDKDFIPLSIFGEGPFILGVNTAAVPARTVQELVSYAKSKPGELGYASGGVGSLTHLDAALFADEAGISLIHVPYRGGGPAIADFLAGHIPIYFGTASEMTPFKQDSRVKLLAVSTPKRMSQLPDLPALAEFYPDFQMTSWNGLIAPANLPAELVDALSKAAIDAAHAPSVVQTLTELGIQPVGDTPADFLVRIRNQRPLLEKAIKAAGLGPS